MAKKSKFIKNLLTTASALAVIAGGASSAFGAGIAAIDNGGYILRDDGGGNAANATVPAGPRQFQNGDSLQFVTAQDGTDEANANIAIASVDTNGIDLSGVTYTVANVGKTTIGNVQNLSNPIANAGSALFKVAVTNDRVLILNGTKYSALGTVTLTGANSTVEITGANNTFTNTFDGGADNNGILDVQAATTFEGVIGGTKALNQVSFTNVKATLQANASAATFNFDGANSELNLNKDGITITGDLAAANGDEGKIDVAGNATITGQNAGLGAGNKLNTILFDTDGGKTLTRVAATAASETALANGVNFQKDGTLVFAGNFDHTVTSAVTMKETEGGLGKLHFANVDGAVDGKTLTISGKIGNVVNANEKLKEFRNDTAATVKLTGDTAHIASYVFGADNVLELNNAGEYKIDKFDTAGQEGIGKLLVSQNVTLTAGHIDGVETKKIKEIDLTNKTLTIGDKSVLMATDLKSAVAGNGGLVFSGAATFDAKTTAAANIAKVTVGGGADKVVDYKSDLHTTDLDFSAADGYFKFSGQTLDVTNAITSAKGASTIEFARTKELQTIDAVVPDAVKVKFSGAEAVFSKAQTSKDYTFAAEAGTTADLSGSDIGAATFTVADGSTGNVVKFKGAGTNFSGDLSAAKALVFESQGADFTISTNKLSKDVGFRSSNENTNKVTVSSEGQTVAFIGDADKPFSEVTFSGNNNTVAAGIWANNIKVANDKQVIFGGAVGGARVGQNDAIQVGEGTSAVTFNRDDLVLGHKITTTKDGEGTVTFGDIDSTISADIGAAGAALKEVNFSFTAPATEGARNTAELGANVYAGDIKFSNGELEAVKDVNLIGATQFTGALITLGDKTVTSSGGNVTFSGKSGLAATYNADGKGGKFINADNAMALLAGTDLTVAIEDLTPDVPRESVSFVILQNDGSADNNTLSILNETAAKEVTTFGNSNPLSKWTLEVSDNGSLKLVRTNNAPAEFKRIASEQNVRGDRASVNTLLDLVAQAPAGTDAGNFANDLATLSSNDEAGYKEAVERIANSTENSINQHTENVGQTIGARIATVALPEMGGADQVTAVAFDDTVSGVSAGDAAERHGVWFTPFYGNSTQKSRNNAPGYKGDSFGFTVGADTKVNDDTMIGVAATYASSDVKHKDAKRGDKTKIESYMLSVYGNQQLTTNWFLSGSATVGSNNVKNTSIRRAADGKQTAKGKYDSMSFAGELMAGYHYAMDGFSLTPMAGFRYSRVNDGGYKESGTSNQNLDINKKASDKFDLIAGLRLSGSVYDMHGVSVTPEVHGFVHHDLVNKNAKVVAKLNGIKESLPQTSAKPIKTIYNLGLGANARHGMMEYGATYDVNFGKKYTNHQGTLKVRVNF